MKKLVMMFAMLAMVMLVQAQELKLGDALPKFVRRLNMNA